MPYWCAQTEGNREHIAERFLQMNGYQPYFPRISERGRIRPLFPSYIFVAQALQWHRARWTVGVMRIVAGSGGEPAVIGDHIIDELKGREKDGLVVLPEPPRLRPGDPVRVTTGLLAGALGIYAGMRGTERVAVLLGFLGSAVLPTADVEALSR
jgi:transcription antitermination factor NusG